MGLIGKALMHPIIAIWIIIISSNKLLSHLSGVEVEFDARGNHQEQHEGEDQAHRDDQEI